MLFHQYLEELLGSKLKIKILRTLWRFQEKEFTIRELAKFLGISHTGVRKVLTNLEMTNVVTIRTVGKSYAFKINTKSYAASIIEKIFESEQNTLLELIKMLKKGLSTPEIVSVALFGSIAQKKEAPLSDVDLLIVTKEREKVENIVLRLQKQVVERFGNSISAYYLTRDDFMKKRKSPLIKQILKNHILILGKPIGESYVR